MSKQPEEGGQTLQYVDNITEVVWARSLEDLKRMAETRASSSVLWLEDNGMVLLPHKIELLIMGTNSLRRARGALTPTWIAVAGTSLPFAALGDPLPFLLVAAPPGDSLAKQVSPSSEPSGVQEGLTGKRAGDR